MTIFLREPALKWKSPLSGQLPSPLMVGRPQAPMPFFCRIEHRIGQQTALLLKFRLGDVPYVDRLEGKRRWYE